jgi:hypothetical protein
MPIDLKGTMRSLEDFDADPIWAILASRGKGRSPLLVRVERSFAWGRSLLVERPFPLVGSFPLLAQRNGFNSPRHDVSL